jgi:Uma2 family endonuclease
MEWAQVINNPFLKNLPFKIELNKWGKILMSPASNNHGRLQYEVGALIDKNKGSGKIIIECSIETSDGVKVADVAWASDEFLERYAYNTPYIKAPEICVEIISPSNSKGEIEEKIQLYLAKGALEVWTVEETGKTRYFSYEGELNDSTTIQGVRNGNSAVLPNQ